MVKEINGYDNFIYVMGGSKGGHANKDDWDDNSPWKTMITFENVTLEVMSIQEIVPITKVDAEAEHGSVFGFEVRTSTWSEHHVFTYNSEDIRDKKMKKFRSKLMAVGVNLI